MRFSKAVVRWPPMGYWNGQDYNILSLVYLIQFHWMAVVAPKLIPKTVVLIEDVFFHYVILRMWIWFWGESNVSILVCFLAVVLQSPGQLYTRNTQVAKPVFHSPSAKVDSKSNTSENRWNTLFFGHKTKKMPSFSMVTIRFRKFSKR